MTRPSERELRRLVDSLDETGDGSARDRAELWRAYLTESITPAEYAEQRGKR